MFYGSNNTKNLRYFSLDKSYPSLPFITSVILTFHMGWNLGLYLWRELELKIY